MSKAIIFTAIVLFICLGTVGQTLPKVKIVTTMGEIVVEVDTLRAPVTATNFLKHVKGNTYDNGLFYRVVRMDNQPNNKVKIEVIQGGVFSEKRLEKIPPIVHETTKETGLKHLDGTISMARMGPGTASTEFFICVNDQPALDFEGKRNPDGQGFAAFGRVVEGMDVVRAIQKQKDEGQTLKEKIVFRITEMEK